MRNVFLFIRRYFTFLSFLVLQVVSLLFLFNYNRFHRAKGLGVATEVTGWLNTRYNKVENYFYLKEENKRLHKFNDSLLNLLPSNFLPKDTGSRDTQDSIPYDTLGHYRRYRLRDAEVIYSSVGSQSNVMQLNRGSNNGVRDNMGVISSDGGVVGVIINVSGNVSQVMPLLDVQNSSTIGSMKRSGEFGTVDWDGVDPRFVYLRRLPKSVDVKKGDTVVTAQNSFILPPGYRIGTVEEIKVDNTTGMYVLKLRTAVNFYTLQQVHVIENLQGDEQRQLLKDTRDLRNATKPGTR